MKIRLEQLNPIIGDIDGNSRKISEALKKAEASGIDLLILQEMVLTGYPLQDLIEKDHFRKYCYRENEKIIESTDKTALLFGTVTPNNEQKGRKMYNSALLARGGELLGITHKTLLPTYDVFDDLRYFEPNKEFECIELDGVNFGITICEDIWYNENEVQYHYYDINPAKVLANKGADIIVNISASPFTATKHENRIEMLKKHARSLSLPVLYCNQTGAHTELVFDGDSIAINGEGIQVSHTTPFEEDFTDVEYNPSEKKLKALPDQKTEVYPQTKDERLFRASVCGIRDYFRKTGVTDQAVIGLSGGIDSSLTAVLAVEALGTDNVTGITMPAEYSSAGSVTDSEKLTENLGIRIHNISIHDIVDAFGKSLHPLFKDTEFGVAEENIQSRIRGTLLMAYANKYGCLLITTGNKSEYAVGYATMYGDMNGALAPIGDMYKTEVFSLSNWLNNHYFKKEVIPNNVLEKPPSAELRPGQKDTDSLPEYEILDDILYRYLELLQSENEISKNYDNVTVREVLHLVNNNEFKRYQAAPILKMTSKSFGSGRRMPLVQKWKGHRI